jgi:hypothetical protein
MGYNYTTKCPRRKKLLFFNRAAIARKIEKGLAWQSTTIVEAPRHQKLKPSGVFVSVPILHSAEEVEQFTHAIAVEAEYVLGEARPSWIELEGSAVNGLSPAEIKQIANAVGSPSSLGMEINLRLLAPGALAGYRSVGVERFSFRMDSREIDITEPVRRARAMGAFTSVTLVLGKNLTGTGLIKAAEAALLSAPSQICLCVTGRNIIDGALLEKTAALLEGAGLRRESTWVFSQVEHCFDSLGKRMQGHCAGLGPGAVTVSSSIYENPPLQRWLETRLDGGLEVGELQLGIRPWLDLAGGLYTLHVRRGDLDRAMLSVAAELEGQGAVDGQGRPKAGWPMEICHRAARSVMQALALDDTED